MLGAGIDLNLCRQLGFREAVTQNVLGFGFARVVV